MPAEWTILSHSYPLWLVAAITTLLAGLARILRGVSLSGAIAGGLACCVLTASAGPPAFVLLALLFVLTWSATRVGYQHKQKLGTAEKKEGRTASQVLANVGVAALCAAIYRWHGNAVFLIAMCAALAEPAADTVSSEIGQASSREARLITNWRKVPAGTNGGTSIAGTFAGMGAAALMTVAAHFTGMISRKALLASFVSAVVGMISDSYLGATLEWRGVLNNNTVNFLGTLSSVCVVVIWYFLFSM
jgi:uncharacterized protein (TIGR00297 family)